MKKFFFLLALLSILAVPTLFAQGVSFGIRAGVSLSNIRGEDADNAAVSQYLDATTGIEVPQFLRDINVNSLTQADPSSITSFFAGGYLNMSLLDVLELEPGLYIAGKGYKLENGVLGIGQVDITNRSYYLEVPVYARLFISEGLNIYAGPQFSVLLSNTFKTDISAAIASFDFESDGSSELNNVDVGLATGIGYHLPFGLNVQVGYDFGFIRFTEDADAYNGVWKLGAGITF